MADFKNQYRCMPRKITDDELAYIEYLRNLVREAYDNRPFEIRVEWRTVQTFWNEDARPGESVVSLREQIEYPYYNNSVVYSNMRHLRKALYKVYGSHQAQKLYEEYTGYIEGPFELGIKATERRNADPVRKMIGEWFHGNN